MSKFFIHQDIEFEISPLGSNPRWVDNQDMGYSGEWAKGVIFEVEDEYISTVAEYPDGKVRDNNWPNWQNPDYSYKQWKLPGYLKHRAISPECECGCGNRSGTHYFFCPLFAWLREQERAAKDSEDS